MHDAEIENFNHLLKEIIKLKKKKKVGSNATYNNLSNDTRLPKRSQNKSEKTSEQDDEANL